MEETSSWILVRKDGHMQHTLPFGMSFIGREECDILLQSTSVDKRHAVIFYDSSNKEVRIKDLNSLTGTYVNNVQISGQSYVPLKNLDSIRFGYGPDFFFLHKVPSPLTPKKEVRSTPPSQVLPEKRNNQMVPPSPLNGIETDIKGILHDSLEDVREIKPIMVRSVPPTLTESEMFPLAPSHEPKSLENTNLSTPFPSSDVAEESFKTSNSHQADKSDFSPVSMAFTIAFDNDISLPKKKLGIKDSISKFAPRKNEIEKPPTQKLKHSKSTETTPKHSKPPEQPPKKPYNGRTSSSREKETKRKGSTSSNEEGSISSSTRKANSAPPARFNGSLNNKKLSDSANFLIQRMFSGASPPPKSPIKNNRKNASEDMDDSKSDTGTYTVEADPQVSEAREKIDEVFGVKKESLKQEDPVINKVLVVSPLSENNDKSEYEHNTIPLSRPKRKLPIPPLNQAPLQIHNTKPVIPRPRRSFSSPHGGSPETTPPPVPRSFCSPTEVQSDVWTNEADSRCETVSQGSDHSSSQGSRGENIPQMRLNRAFALRRARLGIDAETPPAVNPVKPNKPTKAISPALNLSRQDGGRFSLRLPRSANKPKAQNEQPKQQTLRDKNLQHLTSGHRGIESDPCKWRNAGSSTLSDSDRSKAHYGSASLDPSFHRSASFNGTDRQLNPTLSPRVKRSVGKSREMLIKTPAGIPRFKPPTHPPGYTSPTITHNSSPDNSDILRETLGVKKELSALDSLVISAIYQLSYKLRTGARNLLEKESQHQPENSDSRLMIEEVLPQIADKSLKEIPPSDGNLTRDLSSILKNLKRVEQTLEVMSSLMDSEMQDHRKISQNKRVPPSRSGAHNLFVIDV